TGLAFFLGLDTPKWWLKGLAFVAAAFMVHGVLFSFSRGGMLALIVTGVVAFILLPKRLRDYLFFLLGTLVTLRLAGPSVMARFGTSFAGEGQRDGSAEERLTLWPICWDLMKKHPWGIGADQFGVVSETFGFTRGKLAHSLWLQLGAEVGFLGLG